MSYCIEIDAELDTNICPLAKGDCYWQHKKTNRCSYTEQDLTSKEFADVTGKEDISTNQLESFRLELRAAI